MKTMAKTAALLVVLGFCLPSYGEILVYKWTQTVTWYEQQGGEWEVKTETWRGYDVLEVTYDDYAITQEEDIAYGKDASGKWFRQQSASLELVRATYDDKVQWIVMHKMESLNDAFAVLSGGARGRNIGTGENREVAYTLSGYAMTDQTEDGGRYLDMSKIKMTLYPAWTYWANGDGEGEGNQDFDATVQMIRDYLVGKGYEEEL